MKTCALPDCAKSVHHRGLCSMHAARLARTGTTDPGTRPWSTQLAFERRVTPGEPDQCWQWQGVVDAGVGYGRLGRRWAHRVSWELANGRPIPPGLFVLHSCDNRLCVNPAHLRVGTHDENMQDAVDRDRLSRAVRASKISAGDAREIRRRRIAGESRVLLASEYGLSTRQVWMIAAGRAWADA